jgi:hypothetical protein
MKKYFVLLFILLFSVNAFAANHYIRAGATGANNGSSWANAWTTFGAATWTRGDTYYVAGGTYTENVSISSASGTSWTYIKKANASDNGSDPGWDPSYATTQAVINGYVTISHNYLEINGVTGGGPSSWDSGHGIKIHPFTINSVINAAGSGPIRLLHLEINGYSYSSSSSFDGIYYSNTGGSSQKGFYIGYCYIHDIGRNGVDVSNIIGTSWSDYGMLYEYNFMARTGGVTNGDHGQGMQISYNTNSTYLIIRNNKYQDVTGTGFIVYLAGSGTHSYSRIYNNVMYYTDPSTYGTCSPGPIYAHKSTDHFYIYNNTFYKLSGAIPGSYTNANIVLESSTSEVYCANNLFSSSHFASGGNSGCISLLSNNDYYNNNGSVPTGETNQKSESVDPFVNSAGYDFRVKSTANARDSGIDLSSVFKADIVGTPRPQGLGWDIGAYEYYTGPNPSPPSDLKIVPKE